MIFFVVERGFKLYGSLNNSEIVITVKNSDDNPDWWKGKNSQENESVLNKKQVDKNKEERYDRSYNGLVFKAIDVQGDVILSKVVARDYGYGNPEYIGQFFLLRNRELELMVVPKSFIKHLNKGNKKMEKTQIELDNYDFQISLCDSVNDANRIMLDHSVGYDFFRSVGDVIYFYRETETVISVVAKLNLISKEFKMWRNAPAELFFPNK